MFVACSVCHKRFEAQGYRDVECPSCGGFAQPRPCPRCDLPLQPRQIHDLVIDECSTCRGNFVDATAKRLLAEQDDTRGVAFFEAVSQAPDQLPLLIAKPHLACPACGSAMERKLTSSGAGVVIDICKTHGTFYDAGELRKILVFARRTAAADAARKAEDPHADERMSRDDESTAEAFRVAVGVAALAIRIILLL